MAFRAAQLIRYSEIRSSMSAAPQPQRMDSRSKLGVTNIFVVGLTRYSKLWEL